jgi:hypothetical protein
MTVARSGFSVVLLGRQENLWRHGSGGLIEKCWQIAHLFGLSDLG